MKYPCRRAVILWTTAFVVLPFALPVPTFAQSGPITELKVGTFSRAYVVRAYYNSNAWRKKLQDMMNRRNQAALASDTDTVDRLDNEMRSMQALAQRQLSGDAPLTNIYEALKSEWPAIAKEAGVDVIVASPLYLAPGAVLQDVTPVIIRHLSGGG